MKFPAIPKNFVTLEINGLILDRYLRFFVEKFLPQYDIEETSGYRNQQKNEEVGGAEYSAHLYNLAKDFTLRNRSTGQIVSNSQLKKIYDEFIDPHWDGYTKFYPSADSSGHIHVNLDRDITTYTGYLGLAAVAVGGAWLFNVIHKKWKSRK